MKRALLVLLASPLLIEAIAVQASSTFPSATLQSTSVQPTGVVTQPKAGFSTQVLAQATSVAAQAAQAEQRIKVFLPKNPQQQTTFGYVQPVWRQTASPRVAQFAVEQVIAGPSTQEKRLGFVAPVKFKGASSCGKDFTLSIVSGVARLQFCKQIVSAGVGDDARLTSSINATLKQFSTIRSVVILDQNGNCLGDMSGDNRCLNRG